MMPIKKNRTRKIPQLLSLAALLFAAAPSFAQMTAEHPALKEFRSAGGKVDFLGNAYGTDGWLITAPKGGVQYAYTTPEGALIVGMMFGPDGKLETRKQLEAFKEKNPDAAAPAAESAPSKSEKLYAELDNAGWVAIGDSQAPSLYVFMNVNCDHCQKFWKDLEPSVKEGKMQLRLVPYGESTENREGGAALLSVENPEEAWRAYVNGDKTALAADKIKEGAYQKLDDNMALAKKWKIPSTPFTLYRRPGDGKLIAIVGRPENTMLLPAEFLK